MAAQEPLLASAASDDETAATEDAVGACTAHSSGRQRPRVPGLHLAKLCSQGLWQPLCEEVVKGKRLLQAGGAELHHVRQQLGRFTAAHLLRFLEHVPLLVVREGVGL
jgi:hypothetical protein